MRGGRAGDGRVNEDKEIGDQSGAICAEPSHKGAGLRDIDPKRWK